jgi:hypothetical protein
VPVFLALVFILIGAPQVDPPDRALAEQMARSGDTEKAMALFRRIVEQNPDDIEARLWIARLALRMGRVADAEAGFRSVLAGHPGHVDAMAGLGMTLKRKGEWQQALTLLSAARVRSPRDPDIVDAIEAMARAAGHSMSVEGFGERGSPDSDLSSGSLEAAVRVTPRLHVEARSRLQRGPGYTDSMAGGGVRWRLGPSTTLGGRIAGGAGNVALAVSDVLGDATHYTGSWEVGGGVRWLSFAGADVIAVSPTLAWDPGGRWRLDGRYTYSRSRFSDSQSMGDHSVMVRDAFRPWRRVSVLATYAHGIESFEQLTVSRIGALGITTVAAGVRINLPSVTTAAATWEHQWRSNDTVIDRVTVSLAQFWP